MDHFIGEGRVNRVEQKTAPSGSPMTVLTVPINQGQDQQGNEKTLWVEVTGWDQDAERYAANFAEGDWVHVAGRLEVNGYLKSKGKDAGQVGLSCRLQFAKVQHLPNNRAFQAMRLALESMGFDLKNGLRPYLDRVAQGERAGGVATAGPVAVGTGYPGGLEEDVPF